MRTIPDFVNASPCIENTFLENSHVQTLAPHGAMVLRCWGQPYEQARRLPPSPQHHPLQSGTKPARDENRYRVKLRRAHKIFSGA